MSSKNTHSTPASRAFIRQQVEAKAKDLKFWPLPAHTVNYLVEDIEEKIGSFVSKAVTINTIKAAFSKAEPTAESESDAG